jgi:hypothetical protein
VLRAQRNSLTLTNGASTASVRPLPYWRLLPTRQCEREKQPIPGLKRQENAGSATHSLRNLFTTKANNLRGSRPGIRGQAVDDGLAMVLPMSTTPPSPLDRSEWDGLIGNRADPTHGPSIANIMPGAVGGSWSSPVKVTGDDNQVYFAKFPELCQSQQLQMSVVTEMVVAEVGRLIGASTCRTVVLRVPDELQGVELKSGINISSSAVHASRVLSSSCVEARGDLPDRGDDDNGRRHVGLRALYDWCFGSDQQWLRDLNDDSATYSHDHGLYLPPNGGYWTEDQLVANVDQTHPLPGSTTGLLPAAVSEVSDALENVSRESLRAILNRVPSSWSVTNGLLECLGWFLERRAPAVAGRIKQLVSS